jgi:hypothetical protein
MQTRSRDNFVYAIWMGACAAIVIVFSVKPFLVQSVQPYVFPPMCLLFLSAAAINLLYTKLKYGRFYPWRDQT